MERSKCELCGQTMVTKKATMAEPYRYEMSGLDNVFLAGIEVGRCGKCDARVPVIPKIEQLHKAIAQYLVFKKDLLSGKGVRGLREQEGRVGEVSGVDIATLHYAEQHARQGGKREAEGCGTWPGEKGAAARRSQWQGGCCV